MEKLAFWIFLEQPHRNYSHNFHQTCARKRKIDVYRANLGDVRWWLKTFDCESSPNYYYHCNFRDTHILTYEELHQHHGHGNGHPKGTCAEPFSKDNQFLSQIARQEGFYFYWPEILICKGEAMDQVPNWTWHHHLGLERNHELVSELNL